MQFRIAHLSDLHFGNPNGHLRRAHVEQILDALLKELPPNSYLVISGDVTFKGQPAGYADALEVLRATITRLGFSATRIILCPGNHDIVKESEGRPMFSTFDEWSSSLRNDKVCTFANRPARHICHDSANFLILNSAYHGDHTYGLVDDHSIQQQIDLIEKNSSNGIKPRIAVIHHHLVPVLADDQSATRNAYGLIRKLQRSRFNLILHGHQHAMLRLVIGNSSLQISGTGSFGYNTPGRMNSATSFTFADSNIVALTRYGISLDAPRSVVRVEPVDGDEI